MNPQIRSQIFQRLRAHNPEPTTELHYSTPFELLIAVMLSAQATDKSVNKASAELFKVAPTPQRMLTLGESRLKQHIKTIGLFNTKARNIIKTCDALLREHHGKVPDNRAALEALPGVGRKTANVVLNTAFGHPTIAVDTHIFRVANRIGLAPGKTVLEVEKKLLKVVPEEFKRDAHHWLILHGRYTCIARKPRCGSCVIEDLCEYKHKRRWPDMLYGSDRNNMRRYFFEAWRKYLAESPLDPMETLVTQVIATHPEYHAIVENEHELERDFTPEQGETNPFLHMGMHLALREQSMTDQPPGVRSLYLALANTLGSDHEAEHQMMECLGDVLWTAQRNNAEPDMDAYFACLRKRAGIGGTA